MKIDIQCIGCSIENDTLAYVHRALSKLESKYNWIESTRLTLTKEKHSEDLDFLMGIRMAIPGPDLYCDARDATEYQATKKSLETISRMLEDKKNKDFTQSANSVV